MPGITNWRRESRSQTLAYRNTETDMRVVLHRALDSYRYKWSGVILVDGYPIWSQGYETKDVKSFRDALRERPIPELSCQECPNVDVLLMEMDTAEHDPLRIDVQPFLFERFLITTVVDDAT
ncbi:DUF7568 family protein [Natrinema salinisoli]|uniref:DUF7568 family protein n=1 Tax=Natrinema salinisoli TaxID=2878535 RepID=UPI001CF0BB06|nr:hypothetical protein [Natrinema salinisoli]